MKRRLATFVLFVASITSGVAFGDGGWTPGNPKPPIPVPDGWLSSLSLFCRDLWNYMF